MQRQGRSSQERIEQSWDSVLVPPQRIYTTVSLKSFAGLKPPKMENVNYLMNHSSLQREGHSLIILRTTESHQDDQFNSVAHSCPIL